MELVASWLAKVAVNTKDDVILAGIRSEVTDLMRKFPPPILQ